MRPDTRDSKAEKRSASASLRRRELLPWPEDHPFRILSIDGGGIKGIYPAAVLAQIEAHLIGGQPVWKYFDMIVGTSTGGILGLGLGAGRSAQDLLNIYLRHGKAVFPPTGWLGRKLRHLRALRRPRYDEDALKELLASVLQDRLLADASTRLCIPAVEGHYSEVFIFKTPHHPDYRKDGYVSMARIGRATSAAPSFFAALDSGGYRYVDGGLWANNPTMVGVVDAMACFALEPQQIKVLSLGCGREPYLVDDAKARGGLFAWREIINAAMDLQSQNAIGQACLLLGPDNLVRLSPAPTKPIELDDWMRSQAELPPLAQQDFRTCEEKIRSMFFSDPSRPWRRFWPPAR